jgi:phosphoribosylcarboxyaminoimidazole (NCAIR) mutase
MKKDENIIFVALILAGILVIFNQVQISGITSSFDTVVSHTSGKSIFLGGKGGAADLSGVDISAVTSTPMAVATVFPELQNMRDEDEILNFMIPTGSPEYSELMGGITFDDPVTSMEYLAKYYYTINEEVKQNNPEGWQRYLSLAAAPKGVSCEYCCGVGPQGADANGKSRCGCKHNPAVLALTLGLIQNTDYSDAEILREVMKWKTMFFPKNMVGVALEVAGTDPSQLKDLPGMVGGC